MPTRTLARPTTRARSPAASTTAAAGCSALSSASPAGRGRLDERDNGAGYTLHREWGYWTLRPVTGWRSLRWITPPPHATRAILGHDRDAARDWGMKALNLG
jgi:hypothetical protein